MSGETPWQNYKWHDDSDHSKIDIFGQTEYSVNPIYSWAIYFVAYFRSNVL